MKSFRKELSIEFPSRMAFLNLTPQVDAALRESGIVEGPRRLGACAATGAGAPAAPTPAPASLREGTVAWAHNDTGEDNADTHLKRQVMGREVVVAVTDGKLDFGQGASTVS